MSTNTGGPAFPQCSYNVRGGYDITGGMTLRDYFAAKAMQSLIAVYNDDKHLVDQYAQRAYEIADAMLKTREELK